MNCAFPIPSPIAALALSRPGRLNTAELSIVSIHAGEIGDPVTWIDEPNGESQADRTSGFETWLFQAVIDDIGAHLPTGTVIIHRPGSVLALLRRILSGWRPALLVDTCQLAADTNAEVALGATAGQAVATAQSWLRLAGTPGQHGRFNWGLEQAEYALHFL